MALYNYANLKKKKNWNDLNSHIEQQQEAIKHKIHFQIPKSTVFT